MTLNRLLIDEQTFRLITVEPVNNSSASEELQLRCVEVPGVTMKTQELRPETSAYLRPSAAGLSAPGGSISLQGIFHWHRISSPI